MASTMRTFIDQPGVPLVEIGEVHGNAITVRQRRLLPNGVTDSVPRLWDIPITFSYYDGDSTRLFRAVLSDSLERYELQTHESVLMIHPNAGEYGYYRWKLPPDLMQRLIDSSKAELSTRERMMLLKNVKALFRTGQLDAQAYMKSFVTLSNDPCLEIVDAVVSSCLSLYYDYVLYLPDLVPPFRRFAHDLSKAALQRVTFDAAPGEEEKTGVIRANVLGLAGWVAYDSATLSWADVATQNYMADPESVDPNLAPVAIMIAARHGDVDLLRDYWEHYKAATDPVERSNYLGAMGCFADSAAISSAYSYTLSDSLQPNDCFTLLNWLGNSGSSPEKDKEKMMSWFMAHYDELVERISPTIRAYLAWFGDGASLERVQRMRAFLTDPSRDIPDAERELAKVEESVRSQIARLERDAGPLREFLLDNSQKSGSGRTGPGK
jgi:aminopeptidase N